jgi:hypothetical protein
MLSAVISAALYKFSACCRATVIGEYACPSTVLLLTRQERTRHEDSKRKL